MKTLEWKTTDRTNWPAGPWMDEPDKKQWLDEATGLPCLAVRNRQHWCGYVGISKNHPLFEKEYSNIEQDLIVHGGLTFADHCAKTSDPSKHVCHLVESGEDDHVWWLGFDCAHSGDISDFIRTYERIAGYPEAYRTLQYVENECRQLAQQLIEIK
jgi:hypothetical protein